MQSRSLSAGYVFRAKLILMLGEGATSSAIRARLGTTNPTITRWKEGFVAAGIYGLDTSHLGQKPYRLTPSLRAKVLNATRRKPADGSTHWSCRKLATALGISFSRRPSQRAHALHSYVLVLAQPSRNLVRPHEREVISRGVFSCVSDLGRKLRRYIRAYSAHAKPFKWKFQTPPATSVTFSLRQASSFLHSWDAAADIRF